MNSSTPALWTGPFREGGVSGQILLTQCFVESVSVFNSVDPDQTSRSAASDLDVHCLPMSLFSSPEHEVLMVSYSWSVNVCRPSFVVRRAASTIALEAYSSYTPGPID